MSKNRALNWWKPAICGVSMLLFATALPAAESLLATDVQGNTVRIYDEPCPVANGWLKLKRAEMKYQGKVFAACWMLIKNHVVIFDEAGDVSPIPVSQFSKDVQT